MLGNEYLARMVNSDEPLKPLPALDFIEVQSKGMLLLGGLIGMFNPSVKQATKDFKQQLRNMKVIKENSNKFVDVFCPMGWVLHDQFPTDLVAQATGSTPTIGESKLKEAFLEKESLNRLGIRFNVPRYEPWSHIFNRSVERSLAGDFLSAVPLILIVIDGICLDQTGQHPFSGAADAPVFDTIASGPGGVAVGLAHFGKRRQKLNSEVIEMPYRHGIVHGLDTNFGSDLVAAKAYNLLWAIINYFDGKSDETERVAKAISDQTQPTLRDLTQGLSKNAETKKLLDAWRARDQVTDMVLFTSDVPVPVGEFLVPEQAAANYLASLLAKNYGEVANCTLDYPNLPRNQRAGKFREILKNVTIVNWQVCGFKDCAPSITEVDVTIDVEIAELRYRLTRKIRLMYCDDKFQGQCRGEAGGRWVAMPMFLNRLPYPYERPTAPPLPPTLYKSDSPA